MGSSRVRRLSGDQMAAYVWLLCEQWERGALPFDVTMVTPGVPKGISDTAVAYVLTEFFPPDPDTNLRRNPKLAALHDTELTKYEGKSKAAAHARAAKTKVSPKAKTNPQIQTQNQNQREDVGVPPAILTAASGYLQDPKTRAARVGLLRSFVQGMTDRPVPEPVLLRALSDMAVAGADFRPVVLKTWCDRAQKLLEGEAGRRAAEGQSSILGHPDANQPYAEDDL